MSRRDQADEDELEVEAGEDGEAAAGAPAGRRRRGGGGDGEGAAHPPVAIDRTDRRILELLRDDGRLPVAALAERVGISRANAYTRLERLRSEGVIRGFAASVDSERLGLGISALVLIAGRQPAWRALRDQLLHMPEIEYCAFTTGEYDALVLVRVPDVETLRDVILERLQSSPAVRATQTIFVLDEVVRRPFVLPKGE
ncbi:MAG TPA: Lrp/AsnC family transcriptional regulator [Candidatus Angelobacter sp.]|jgi:Lrp/AsnC family leucine-responsive transcriptional regulator|nr:Lrp/AsnC family transcriptional regulator [Candidatus Angelobacter sp.]